MYINKDVFEHKTIENRWTEVNTLNAANDSGTHDPLNVMLQEEEKDAIRDGWYDEYLEI